MRYRLAIFVAGLASAQTFEVHRLFDQSDAQKTSSNISIWRRSRLSTPSN